MQSVVHVSVKSLHVQLKIMQLTVSYKASRGKNKNLCGNNVEWCESIKYLGVYLQSGKYVKFNINSTKRAFYAACNTIIFFFIALELRMI